jgi:hypothetical protein
MTEESEFDSVQRQKILPSYTMSRSVLGPVQVPTQCIPGSASLGVKRQMREAHHSSLPNAKVKNVWSDASIRLSDVALS